jgi:murein DD-endopeptidase MepM/ murein hydrolase activator NlpD/LAS superfamily LD-carboxypeptidase LdcB
MRETVAGLQNLGALELTDQGLPEIAWILQQQEQPIIYSMMNYYSEAGIGTVPAFEVKHIVNGRMSTDRQLLETVKTGLLEIGKDWDDEDLYTAGHTAIELFRDEAYARAYVQVTVERALNGSRIRSRDKDTFEEIKLWVGGSDGRIHPAHNRIRDIVWSGIGEALENDDPRAPFAIKDINKIGKAVSPSLDHKINRTLAHAIDILCEIQAGRVYTSKRLDQLVEMMGHPVSEEVRQFGPTAHQNYNIVVAQIADYYRRQKTLDSQKTDQLKKLLQYLHIDVDEAENFLIVPFDPNHAGGNDGTPPSPEPTVPSPSETKTEVVTDFDFESGDVSNPRVKIVPKKSDRNRIVAGVTLVGVASATFVGGMALHDAKDNKHATYVVSPPTQPHVGSKPEADPGSADQSATTPPGTQTPPQAAPNTPAPEAAQPANPAPPIEVHGHDHAGAGNHHGAQSNIPDHVNFNQIPEAAAPDANEARPITNGYDQEATHEALLNDITFKDLPGATTALESTLLAQDGSATESQNTAFIQKVDGITTAIDSMIQARFEKGTIDQETYAKYREMITSARVLALRPGLADAMDEQRANLINDGNAGLFVQAYIDHELSAHNMLGDYEQADQYELIAKFLGSAAAISIPGETQIKFLQHHHIEVITPQSDPSGEQHDQGNGHGSEHGADQPSTTHESGDTTLSPAEAAALDKMESMGPDWHNRAIVLRILMDNGVSQVAASGIVGGSCVEAAGCELDPTVEQFGGGPGRGIIQWEGGRLENLKNYADNHGLDWQNIETQANFIVFELKGSEGSAADALASADTIQQAADIAVNQYERPADANASREARANHAAETYYTLVLLEKQAAIEQSSQGHANGPEIENGKLPTYNEIKAYYDDKYGGNANGLLTSADLETLGSQWGDARLYPAAAEAFRSMATAFQDEFGKPLQLSGTFDAFRPFQVQIDAYTDPSKINAHDPDTSSDDTHMGAEPGTSNHGFGMAVDLASGINSGPDTPEYKWMIANGPEYGFVKPDWAKPGGDKPEPWHFDYAGGVTLAGYSSGQASPGQSGDEHGNSDHQDHGNNNGNESGNQGQSGQESSQQNSDTLVSQAGYGLPVLPTQYVIGTKYEGYSSNGNGNVHTGVDILAKKGSPALAVRDGKVIQAGYDDGAGNYVILLLDNDHSVVYQHLDKRSVSEGDQVGMGDEVGKVGNTGRVISSHGDGTHLHLEINEAGFTGIASHTETVAQVESETLDPLSVLPSVELVNNYIDDHHLERAIGEVAMDSTDGGYDVATSLPGKPPEAGNDNGQDNSQEQSAEQPDETQQPSDGHHDEHQQGWNSHDNQGQRLTGVPQNPSPYDAVQVDDSAN